MPPYLNTGPPRHARRDEKREMRVFWARVWLWSCLGLWVIGLVLGCLSAYYLNTYA